MISIKDYVEAMSILGFTASTTNTYTSSDIICTYRGNCITIRHSHAVFATTKVANAIRFIECTMQVGRCAMPITAAINTKNLAKNLIRVRSSNVWAIGFNVRNQGDKAGDLIMQFKNPNGGAGDLYIYYDVSIKDYRRLLNAPSVGHQFWVSIRNNYKYSRLTGSKKGVLPNAVNNW